MGTTIDTPTIHKSLAQLVLRVTPKAYIFDNPNQQGTALPAWFIVHREPVSHTLDTEGRYWLVYNIDLYYMLEMNTPHLFDDYSSIANALDLIAEYLPIYGSDAIVHTYERSWGMYMDALKYSMTLRFRVVPNSEPAEYMDVIEDLQVFLKTAQKADKAVIYFTNTDYPDFNVDMPSPIEVDKGALVTLPTVTGKWTIDLMNYEPSGWDIGTFGSTIALAENKTTNLLWRVWQNEDFIGQGMSGTMRTWGTDTTTGTEFGTWSSGSVVPGIISYMTPSQASPVTPDVDFPKPGFMTKP